MSEKSADLFTFLNEVTAGKREDFYDTLTEKERGTYKSSRWMVHRFLSMNVHFLPIVNELQKYSSTIPDKQHYIFLNKSLPRGKQYNKYIKGDKSSKYEEWLIKLVGKHYNISLKEALQYINIYYSSNKEELSALCKMYAIDPKMIKKAKL
jgi:GTPase involved in cell partitioning and DNA repair